MTNAHRQKLFEAVSLLRPFDNAIYNDNGDVTLTTSNIHTSEYLGLRKAIRLIQEVWNDKSA